MFSGKWLSEMLLQLSKNNPKESVTSILREAACYSKPLARTYQIIRHYIHINNIFITE